jgi:type VI protein secretion system component VasK
MQQAAIFNTLTELELFHFTRELQEASEFDIFRMAYTDWYGKIPTLQTIENHFDGYLVSGELPFYVRHYCRQFIKQRPETVTAIRKLERRSRIVERLVTGLLIGFVAAALILA